MQPTRSDTLPLRTVEDLVQVRQFVRTRMVEQGFGLLAQTKMVTAASELGRNAVVYGGGGSARVDLLADGERSGMKLHVDAWIAWDASAYTMYAVMALRMQGDSSGVAELARSFALRDGQTVDGT